MAKRDSIEIELRPRVPMPYVQALGGLAALAVCETMGEDAVLRPGNLTNTSRMEIATPEVKISVNPKFSYLVEARVIDGKKYILVSADAGVELNGVAVDIRD